jgi:hypothetical protein
MNRYVFLAVVGLAVAIVVPAAASGSADVATSEVPRASAARQWAGVGAGPLLDFDRGPMADAAKDFRREPVLDEGRTTFVSTNRHVSVAPLENGGLCWSAVESARGNVGTGMCGDDLFPENGASLAYSRGPGTPTTLAGVVASDVSALRVVTSDGREHDVNIQDGVLWWEIEEGAAIDEVSTVRAGTTFTERRLFAGE